LAADIWISSDTVLEYWPLNQQHHSSWVSISESTATQFLTASLWTDTIKVLGCRLRRCRFRNRQLRTGSLLISELAATQFFAADFWISSDPVLDCQFLNQQRCSFRCRFLTQFLLPISKSAATLFLWPISESAIAQSN
jgi:hypothetical protein